MGLHEKKFVMRFYAVRCGQMRFFGNLGGGKTGQDTALEREKAASGRVNTASQSRWVREVASGGSMAERSVLPDCAVGVGRKIQVGGVQFNNLLLLPGRFNWVGGVCSIWLCQRFVVRRLQIHGGYARGSRLARRNHLRRSHCPPD